MHNLVDIWIEFVSYLAIPLFCKPYFCTLEQLQTDQIKAENCFSSQFNNVLGCFEGIKVKKFLWHFFPQILPPPPTRGSPGLMLWYAAHCDLESKHLDHWKVSCRSEAENLKETVKSLFWFIQNKKFKYFMFIFFSIFLLHDDSWI